MDTTPLKSFATSARSELIREVGARVTAVLAQGSPERVEQPRAVNALEGAIAREGGGEKGRAHVADKVAYTWFNRIIALRFMDAKGYTGIGVVSPAADQVGQPEVLAAAKRGQVDEGVVKATSAATITGLLNGTRQPRPGVDAQAEAYELLLADYCRHWNSAMPFMFEREGDYTELLIPANLLAEESVLSRSVKVLTEEVCQDVEVIGWLYQFYISERKDEVFAGFKKNKKAGADEIPAATQLFTPHWIVRYLLENSVGRLWMLNHPESRLVDQMDYYIAPVDEETDFLEITTPEELTVIDPACGSGHMLTYAFDLLYAIYEEEGYTPSQIPGLILTNNLYGTEIDPRAGALAAFALTMKAAAKRKLFLKNAVEPNICVLDPITFAPHELDYLVTEDGDRHAEEAFWNQFAEADTFGSLIQPDANLAVRLARHLDTLDDNGDMLKADALDWARQVIRQAEYLSPRYYVMVANPPYMGSKNLKPEIAEWSKRVWPTSRYDLFAMFIERGLEFVQLNGLVAMITMQSWMFLSAFAPLRSMLLRQRTLLSLVHLGTGAFDGMSGEVVSTAAFVLSSVHRAKTAGDYVRLIDFPSPATKRDAYLDAVTSLNCGHRFRAGTEDFASLPGEPIAYWIDPPLRDSFATPALGRHVITEGQNKTANNDLYLRRIWEVSRSAIGPEARWIPYAKGGPFRRWYGNVEFLVDWSQSAREEYRRNASCRIVDQRFWFRPGITWTDISTNGSGFRWFPAGGTFDMSGPMVFLSDPESYWATLGILNSGFAWNALAFLNPTSHIQLKDVRNIPAANHLLASERLAELSRANVDWSTADWNQLETSVDFRANSLISGEPLLSAAVNAAVAAMLEGTAEVLAREEEIDQLVAAEYGMDGTREMYRAPIALTNNVEYRLGRALDAGARDVFGRTLVADLVSYAVGCMFGRYSLDEPGLILGDQGSTLDDYLAKVPHPTFAPDADNVIPILDGDWFEDDIVELFRRFLRVAFGEQHFEENLRFVTVTLSSISGIRTLRDYFIKTTARGASSKFYDDHVQRYKKRPIYWLFSSPKGSFNALIYLHRYTPSTVSTVLAYLREYVTKLESSLQEAERAGNLTEADRLRKILVELNEYEHDTLYPKASENVVIDLDDGVKANYPKFGAALKKIPGLEAASD